MTSKDGQKDAANIDRQVQLKKNYLYSDVLEEGRFVDYEHPQAAELPVAGYPELVLPSYVRSKTSAYVLIPAAKTAEDNSVR